MMGIIRINNNNVYIYNMKKNNFYLLLNVHIVYGKDALKSIVIAIVHIDINYFVTHIVF